MTFNAELIVVPQRINLLFVTVEVTLLKFYLNNETKSRNENALMSFQVISLKVINILINEGKARGRKT